MGTGSRPARGDGAARPLERGVGRAGWEQHGSRGEGARKENTHPDPAEDTAPLNVPRGLVCAWLQLHPEPKGGPGSWDPPTSPSGPTLRVIEGSGQHKPGPVPSPAASRHPPRRGWDRRPWRQLMSLLPFARSSLWVGCPAAAGGGMGRGLPPPTGTWRWGHGSIRAAKGCKEDGAGLCVCGTGGPWLSHSSRTPRPSTTLQHMGSAASMGPPWGRHGAPAPHTYGAWGRPYSRPQGQTIRAPHPISVVGGCLPAAGGSARCRWSRTVGGMDRHPHMGRPLTANRC